MFTLPEWALWTSLGATLLLGPQLLGGVQPKGILFHATGALGALGAALWVVGRRSASLPRLFWGLVALWLWTLLPALPLPCGWVAWLSPEVERQAQHAFGLVSADRLDYCTLSADPGNTREEVLKWTAILSLFLCAEVLSRNGRRRAVLILVGLAGVLMTVVTLGHLAADADRIFGLYTPEYVHSPLLLSPLVNLNNLGGFLVLTGTVQFGLSQGASRTRTRHAWYGASALSAATVIMTLSRGAVAALVAVVLVLSLKEYLSQSRRLGRAMRTAVPWVFAAVVAVGFYIVSAPLMSEFGGGGLDKIDLFLRSAPLMLQQPLLGLGRGAFGAVFARVYGTTHRFKYVENFVLQWAIEWGVVVTVLLLAAIGMRVLMALSKRRPRLGHRSAAAVAILAYAGQNLFDLGLEVVSCACAAATTLGTLGRRGGSPSPTPAEAPPRRGRFSPLYLLLPGLAALLLIGPTYLPNSIGAIQAQLQQAEAQQGPLTAETEEVLVRGLRLHPQEPLLLYYGGKLLLAKNDRRAPRLINYLLELAPGWAASHVLAARFLAKHGHIQQAALQLRLAAERDHARSRQLACLIAREVPSLTDDLLPADPQQRRWVMVNLVSCLPPDHPAQPELDRQLMTGYPDEQAAFARQSARLRKTGDFAAAEQLLTAQLKRDGRKDQLWGALAQLYVDMDDPQKALQTVERAESEVVLTTTLLMARAQAYALLGDVDAMEDAWSQVRGRAAGREAELTHAYLLLGQLEMTVGRRARALNAFIESYNISGFAHAAVGAANLYEQLGDKERALTWWRKGCASMPDHPVACATARRLEQALAKTSPP